MFTACIGCEWHHLLLEQYLHYEQFKFVIKSLLLAHFVTVELINSFLLTKIFCWLVAPHFMSQSLNAHYRWHNKNDNVEKHTKKAQKDVTRFKRFQRRQEVHTRRRGQATPAVENRNASPALSHDS